MEPRVILAHRCQLHSLSSHDFHTVIEQGWPYESFGVALILFEPWLSKELVAHQHSNRALSPSNIARLEDAMRAAGWLITGQTIIFSTALRLLNGQTRLTAAYHTNTTIQSVAVWNVPLSARPAIDLGRKWSGADHLAAQDVDNSAQVGAALRKLYRLDHHILGTSDPDLPDATIGAYLEQHPTIHYSVTYGLKVKRFIPQSIATPLHYKFKHKDESFADSFFQQLGSGEHLSTRDPVYVLREFYAQKKQREVRERQNYSEESYATMAAHVIMTWNAVRQKRALYTTTLAKWTREVDAIPEIL